MRIQRIRGLAALLLLGMFCGLIVGMAADTAPALWESEYQACERLAEKYEAEREVRLEDGCRVDLLSQTEAIEVDWARKWCEAVGQSLYYAIETDRCAGIILLLRDPADDERFVARCKKVCDHAGIALYTEPARPLPRRATIAEIAGRGSCVSASK